MTAVASQTRSRKRLHLVLAVAVAWSIGAAVVAPAAIAADASPEQWYLDPMKAEEMWKVSTGKGIKVAVIDSGVHASTPSLQGQVLPGKNFTRAGVDARTDDLNGQGTTTAELIAGTGKGGGIRGLAPGAKIIPFRVALHKHNALREVSEDSLYRAVKAAADSDVQIINISVGSQYAIGVSRFGQADALNYAAKKGKLIFAGTGDNAQEGNKTQYPAKSPEAVGVASIGRDGNAADYSQYGEDVDLAAPGSDIPRWCDAKFKRYCIGSGSSASTAIASASAALIWSKHPDWTASQVLRVLYDTASRNWVTGKRDARRGHGLIRPRDHLLEGKGRPGDSDHGLIAYGVHPNPDAPDAPSSPSAKTGKPAGSQAPGLASSSKETANSGSSPLVIGGIAAAVLVLAVGAVAVIRRRRAH